MPLFRNEDKAEANTADTRSTIPGQVRLGFVSTYYTMAQALGLQKLHDLVLVCKHGVCYKPHTYACLYRTNTDFHSLLQGSSSLSMSDGPIWLLGVQYAHNSNEGDSDADQAVRFA